MTPQSTWSDDAIGHLRRMAREKWTCREMADALGVTRNAVIGKLHRLGISTGNPRKAKQKTIVVAPRKPRSNAGPQVQAINARIANKVDEIKGKAIGMIAEAEDVTPLHIGLMDLTEKTCRFPYGDRAPFTFCGCEKIDSGPYCYGHSKIARSNATTHEGRAKPFSEEHLRRVRERRAA